MQTFNVTGMMWKGTLCILLSNIIYSWIPYYFHVDGTRSVRILSYKNTAANKKWIFI